MSKSNRFTVVQGKGKWVDVVDTTLTNGKGKPMGRVIARANPTAGPAIVDALNERA